MIFTDRKITIRNGKSSINEPVILYRGDFEVSIRFTIMESKFRFKSGVNLVDSEKASFGQLAILAPYGGNVFSEVVKCEDGTVTFTLTKEMIDQLEEVGLYSFQIRLFDYYRESRVSIPPVEFGIEVREPVASEDHDNEVNNAIVGYSIAKVVDPSKEDVGDTFNADGNYNKTNWKTGDRITEGKLNKIEDALDKINYNEKKDVAALDKRVTNNFNVLDANKVDKNEVNSKVWHMANMGQDVKEAMTGGSVAVVGENAVDTINIKRKAVTPDKINLGGNAFESMPLVQGTVGGNVGADLNVVNPNTKNRCVFSDVIVIGDPEEQSIRLLNYTEYRYAVFFGDDNNIRVGGGNTWHAPGDSNPRTLSYIAQLENYDISKATCVKIQLRRADDAAFVPESVDVSNTIVLDSQLILSTDNIKNDAITTDKYADRSITRKKLDTDTNKLLDVTEGLMYNYTDNLEIPTIKTYGTAVTHAYFSQSDKTIIYETYSDSEVQLNDAIYLEEDCMRFRYSAEDSSGIFIVISTYIDKDTNTPRICHFTLSGTSITLRMHGPSAGVQKSVTINNGVLRKPNIGELMTLYVGPTEIRMDGETDFGETYNVFTLQYSTDIHYWFDNPVVGFLVTNNGTANLNNVYDIRFPSSSGFDIAKETEVQTIKERVNKIEYEVGKISSEIYDTGVTIPPAQWVDTGRAAVCENNSIGVSTNSNLNGTYDWVTVSNDEIYGLEFTTGVGDSWLVLETNSDNTLALAISINYHVQSTGKGGWIRLFTDAGRAEIKGATFINTNAKPDIGCRCVIKRISDHKYQISTMKPGETKYISWVEVDFTDIDGKIASNSTMVSDVTIDIQDFHTSLGHILYYGYSGSTLMTNIKGLSSGSSSLKNTIIKIIEDMNIYPGSGGAPANVVDLVMFMGQSNMAGRGVAAQSPIVPEGHGYEFRAISDPTKLYPIVEPFGKNENNSSSGVTETTKTGSMVSSFVLNYYKVTKVPIVAVSCSKGGTNIGWWQPGGGPLNDAIARHELAKNWLETNGYIIRHDFMVWCQGCSDGDGRTSADDYTQRTKNMIEAMMACGVEKCFLVRIGNHRDDPTMYYTIIQAQTELCKTYENAVLVSCKLAEMAELGLMKDQFHYLQEGYNIVGKDAGINTAFYINNLKEPTMWDPENDNLYFSHK